MIKERCKMNSVFSQRLTQRYDELKREYALNEPA